MGAHTSLKETLESLSEDGRACLERELDAINAQIGRLESENFELKRLVDSLQERIAELMDLEGR